MCVPAYYAHLAAKRGRAMLTGNFSDTASVASGISQTEVAPAQHLTFPCLVSQARAYRC